MMTCREARALLPEVAGGELAGTRADAVRSHASGCVDCGRQLEQLDRSIALCRRAGSAPLPEGFQLELRRRLAELEPPRLGLNARLRRLVRLPRWTALLATAALGGVLAVAVVQRWGRGPAAMAYRLPQSKVALVKVDFVADAAIEDVQFEVLLPDGLRFYAGGQPLERRSFSWQGRLAAGSNPIPIAVQGSRPGRYRVIAHASGADLDVVHEVIIEVTS
jgi:hypothetical protein